MPGVICVMLPSGGRGGYELDPSLQLHPLARQRIAQAGLPVDLIGLSAEQSAPDASVQRWQGRLQPVWGALAGCCHLGRDIPALLTSAGFTLTTSQTRYLPGPRPFTFHYWGEAVHDAPGLAQVG